MFNLDKIQDVLKNLASSLEDHRKKSLRATMTTSIFTHIVNLQMKEEDLVATAKVAVHLTDIILKELGEK